MNQVSQPDLFLDYDNGFYCKCCGAYNKRYKRKFNSNMAVALIALYKEKTGLFVHMESYLASMGLKRCGDATYLRLYNFIDKRKELRQDGSDRNGFYRITGLGCLFIEGKITARETFLILHNRLEGFEGEEITIQYALGKKFNYNELMNDHSELTV